VEDDGRGAVDVVTGAEGEAVFVVEAAATGAVVVVVSMVESLGVVVEDIAICNLRQAICDSRERRTK
jgi:hypothetical protein